MSPLPDAGVWVADTRYSTVRFAITHHAVTTWRSGFADFTASFDGPSGTLTGTVRVDSVQAIPPLRERLAQEDFFDVAAHPEMRFASTSIEDAGDHLVVAGDLTIKGVTRQVRATGRTFGVVPVTHFPEKTTHEHMGLDLELAIDRRDFGVSYNNELSNGLLNLGYDVRLEVALELARTDPIQTEENG